MIKSYLSCFSWILGNLYLKGQSQYTGCVYEYTTPSIRCLKTLKQAFHPQQQGMKYCENCPFLTGYRRGEEIVASCNIWGLF